MGLENWFGSTLNLPDQLRGGVVAIGNFDGVHLGHQAVIKQTKATAKELNTSSVILTFEPHPRSFFKPQMPVFRLTTARQKAEQLFCHAIDAVISETFDQDFANLTADEFIEHHLIEGLGARHVITGFNFHFGKGRSGTPQHLCEAGKKHGFQVSLVEAFSDPDEPEKPVSSSRVRQALAGGDITTANRLLARAFEVRGRVAKGAQLGRTLGFPTANIRLPDEANLAHGIYAVRIRRADGSWYDGVASFGRRPTFDNGAPLLESFVFDFNGDLYDEEITIAFFGWIRAEEKFDNVEALVTQMKADSAFAKEILDASRKPVL